MRTNVSIECDEITTTNWKIVLSLHFRCVRMFDGRQTASSHSTTTTTKKIYRAYVYRYFACCTHEICWLIPSCIWQKNICNITRRQQSCVFSACAVRIECFLRSPLNLIATKERNPLGFYSTRRHTIIFPSWARARVCTLNNKGINTHLAQISIYRPAPIMICTLFIASSRSMHSKLFPSKKEIQCIMSKEMHLTWKRAEQKCRIHDIKIHTQKSD